MKNKCGIFLTILFSCLVGCGDEPSSPSSSEKPGESDGNTLSLIADSAFFEGKFKSSHIRIAFTDELTDELNYIEIDGDSLRSEIIETIGLPQHPQFSPDGSKLAYSTGLEGVHKPSDLYVIDLLSREIYKLDVENAAIPRWRVLENGDSVIVYNDYVGSDAVSNWDESATYQVVFAGNKFGTPEKLFNRSYNGGVSPDNSLAVTGASRLLFHYAQDEDSVNIDMYNGEQVCNVSISRDSSKIVAFLETRGSMGVEFTHDQYNWHGYVFYMDSTGKLLKAIKGKDNNVFNGTEWLFVPGFQVGTLTTSSDRSEIIVLIDYERGDYSPILKASGKQVMNPDLWVDL